MENAAYNFCPICNQRIALSLIQAHVNACLNGEEVDRGVINTSPILLEFNSSPPAKRLKVDNIRDRNRMHAVADAAGGDGDVGDVDDFATPTITNSQNSLATVKTSSMLLSVPDKSQAWGCLANSVSMSVIKSARNSPKNATTERVKSNESASLYGKIGRNRSIASRSSITIQPKVGVQTSINSEKMPTNKYTVDVEPVPSGSSTASSNDKVKQVQHKDSFLPLAERMRPLDLVNYIGQDEALTPALRSLLESHQVPSMIFWGPPGCGKTTLARIISARSKRSQTSRFVQLSATTSGIADVKEVIKVAKNEQSLFKRRTILFVDEIHRFNKLQQDSFLPHVEDGSIILIGATTENPSFHVNNALLSRCRVITLEKLSVDSVCVILKRALNATNTRIVTDKDERDTSSHSDGSLEIVMEEQGVETLANLCDGDARVALNALQSAIDVARTAQSNTVIGGSDIKESLQRSQVQYDRAGEEHYNCVSALIKSMRGSDDSAAIYWLMRMLEGGEDPKFVARRLVAFASEDIGVADSQSLVLAVAAYQASHFNGMPECALNLAHCVVHLSRAPKSTACYEAMKAARACIRQHVGPQPSVPLHLRNAPTKLMRDLKYGEGYKYNPAFEGPVDQQYLPAGLCSINFFSKT